MTKKIKSTREHNGFHLKNDITFDSSICIFIGRNGCGKTRLLQGIANRNINIIDSYSDAAIDTTSIIDLSIINTTNFSYSGYSLINHDLAVQFFLALGKITIIDDVPSNIDIPIQEVSRGIFGPNIFNLRDIFKRAIEDFDTNLSDLSTDELKLSIILNKEYAGGKHDGKPLSPSSSLSQLTLNYYQAIEIFETLKEKYGKSSKIFPKAEIKYKELIATPSPSLIFNQIITKLFRGKFIVEQPTERDRTINYTPKLISKATGEIIETQSLSSGEKTIFCLALNTFEAAYSAHNSILHNKKVVMLDEPDAHLHPQMVLDFYGCLQELHEKLGIIFIFTTHSPTTVALAPVDNIFNLEHDEADNRFTAKKVTKDKAISELLDGVSQIAVDPANSRQVYVENENDGATYDLIYKNIKNRASSIDKGITLSFISSGKKIARSELEKHIETVYGKDDGKIENLVNRINGSGSCEQVIGVVEHLKLGGNRTVRGLIDWDRKNRTHCDSVKVSAKNYAYSIENLIYDPISIYAYLASNNARGFISLFNPEEDFVWKDLIEKKENLQQIVDVVTKDLLGKENSRDHKIEYMNGISLMGDKEYFIPAEGNGHDFEGKILKKYGILNQIHQKSSGLPMIYHFLNKVTLGYLSWGFINKEFEKTFSSLQD